MECGQNLVTFLRDLLPPSTLKIEAAESHETSINFYKLHSIKSQRTLLSYFLLFFFDIFPANETLYPQKQSSYQTDSFLATACHITTDSYSHLTQHTPAGLTVII